MYQDSSRRRMADPWSRYSRVRVCAVGGEADIRRVLIAMASRSEMDCGELHSMNITELADAMARYSQSETRGLGAFLYEMVARRRYGSALCGCGDMTVRNPAGNLWAVLFVYESDERFQSHEWLALHRECGGVMMSAQYACSDFRVDHGRILFAGGAAQDLWDYMDPCWFWVIHRYGDGMERFEVLRALEQARRAMLDYDDAPSIPVMLNQCRNGLTRLLETPDFNEIAEQSSRALSQGDFLSLRTLRFIAAERILWDTEYAQSWLSAIDSAMDAWPRRG